MGICPSTDGQSESGFACGRQEQNCRNSRQPANEHTRRVLATVIKFFRKIVVNFFCLFVIFSL